MRTSVPASIASETCCGSRTTDSESCIFRAGGFEDHDGDCVAHDRTDGNRSYPGRLSWLLWILDGDDPGGGVEFGDLRKEATVGSDLHAF